MSDDSDSDSFLQQKRKRNIEYAIEDDDDNELVASDSSIEKILHTKRIKGSKKNCIQDSDSDSDSSIETFRHKRRVGVSSVLLFALFLSIGFLFHYLFILLIRLAT